MSGGSRERGSFASSVATDAEAALLGRNDEALRWLERMTNDGMPNYALLSWRLARVTAK